MTPRPLQLPLSIHQNNGGNGSNDQSAAPDWKGVLIVTVAFCIVIAFLCKVFRRFRHRPPFLATNTQTGSTSRHHPPHQNNRASNTHTNPSHHQTGPFAPNPLQSSSQTIRVPAYPRAVFSAGRYVILSPDAAAAARVQSSYPDARADNRAALQQLRGEGGMVVQRYNPDNLPSFDVNKNDAKNPCPICLVPLEEEMVSSGHCLHLMHTSCLKSWLVKDVHSACPICRVAFTDVIDESDDGSEMSNETRQQPLYAVAAR